MIALVNRIRTSVQLSSTQAQELLGYPIAATITPAPELAYQASINRIPILLLQPDSLTAQQMGSLANKLLELTH